MCVQLDGCSFQRPVLAGVTQRLVVYTVHSLSGDKMNQQLESKKSVKQQWHIIMSGTSIVHDTCHMERNNTLTVPLSKMSNVKKIITDIPPSRARTKENPTRLPEPYRTKTNDRYLSSCHLTCSDGAEKPPL